MEILQKKEEKGLVITLIGHLDAMTSTDVQKELLKLLDQGNKTLVVDLHQVHHLSSAGIRAILITAKRAKELKSNVCLVGLNSNMQESLDMAGLLTFFKVYPDLKTALSQL